MATNIPTQIDFKIELPGETQEKATLKLSPTGDIQICEGSEKLAAQIIRAVVNDDTITNNLINAKGITTKLINTLLVQVLRQFKQTQVNDVRASDPDFSGYKIYRKASSTNDSYVQVSPDPIVWRFIDTELTNGTSYDYGITRITGNVFESAFVDTYTVTPTQFSNRISTTVGGQTICTPGDKQVTFNVDYNRKFKASELLEKVISIDIQQDPTEPRRYVVGVVVENFLGNKISVASKRFNIGNI